MNKKQKRDTESNAGWPEKDWGPRVCVACGKAIKGLVTVTNPSNLARLQGCRSEAFHPACYERAEVEAGERLKAQMGRGIF